MNINGVEYVEADTDLTEKVKMLENALRLCEKTMICRQNEVGNRYGRAASDIREIVKLALKNV